MDGEAEEVNSMLRWIRTRPGRYEATSGGDAYEVENVIHDLHRSERTRGERARWICRVNGTVFDAGSTLEEAKHWCEVEAQNKGKAMDKNIKALRAKYKSRKQPKRMAQMGWNINLDYSNSRPAFGPGSQGGKRGRRPPDASYTSKDGRWFVREANYGGFVLKDRRNGDKVYLVSGTTLPDVEDKIAQILATEEGTKTMTVIDTKGWKPFNRANPEKGDRVRVMDLGDDHGREGVVLGVTKDGSTAHVDFGFKQEFYRRHQLELWS